MYRITFESKMSGVDSHHLGQKFAKGLAFDGFYIFKNQYDILYVYFHIIYDIIKTTAPEKPVISGLPGLSVTNALLFSLL